MRLSISNIAWDISEDDAVAELLNRYQIDAIDIAPSKYFPEMKNASDSELLRIRDWWAQHGIEIYGMQSLLFGTTGLNVFGPPNVQDAMLDHLTAVCRIGSGLKTSRLVFGSPKNRDKTGILDARAVDIAVNFFRLLGKIADDFGQVICLEPNPTSYGANFMTTSVETADIVNRVAHPAIKMQLDTGSLTINREEIQTLLPKYADMIGHVHASEPQLATLGNGPTDHQSIFSVLEKYLPNHVVCVEMLTSKNEGHLISIDRALGCATTLYRSQTGTDR
ncbi:sugar phosphate isomerase/epimerase [Achromobacter kerstersii]|jgi:sugar phosphate isomerase/epimerase|uniref:sugar phosphate isomerase/epimerase family protein n=1 Tax=Achromobacter kerstersii TaxID=1353890 RepID=UPI00313D4993